MTTDAEVGAPGSHLRYHELQLAGRPPAVWRPVLGIIALGVGTFLVAPLVLVGPYLAWLVWTGSEADRDAFIDLTDPTPAALSYLLLSIAVGLPLCWLVMRVLHGLGLRWLHSVALRLRWGFLAACLGLSIVSLIATVAVSAVLPAQQTGAELGAGDLVAWDDRLRDFLLVIVLLTPLQAAAEEYVFRGYLLQSFGGMLRRPWFAVLLSSVLFALAHGLGQGLPIFLDRFAFGIVAGTLVILTGGLEAGIAMHVTNNWLAFTAAVLFDQLGTALNPTGGTWWSLPVTLTQSLTYLVLAWWVARQMGLAHRTDPAILEASRPRV